MGDVRGTFGLFSGSTSIGRILENVSSDFAQDRRL